MTETTTDTFAAAFAQLAKDDDAAPAAPAAAAPAEAAPAAAAEGAAPQTEMEAAAAAAAGGEGEGDATGAAEGDGGEGAEGTEPEAEEDNTDLLNRLANLVRSAPAEVQQTQQTPQQTQPQPQQQAPVEIYSPEEKELLSSYEKDWPDVARAEGLRRKGEYKQLVEFVFTSIAKELAPIISVVQTLGERTHLTDLHQAAPDYSDVRDKVVDWVKDQPAYLRAAYQHVIQQGTVDEVADLINRYRQATGATAQPAARSAPAPKKDTELPAATKQAVASLAPVSSKRSVVVQEPDPNDFEAAFASFAKSA